MTNMTETDLEAALFGITTCCHELLKSGVHIDAILVALGKTSSEHFQVMPEAERDVAMRLWMQGIVDAVKGPTV